MIDLKSLVPPASGARTDGPIDVASLVAPVGFQPKEWQTGAPEEAWGWKPAVKSSPDLDRIVALPRRPPPDVERAGALVEYVTAKYGRPAAPGGCRCAAMGRTCIDRLMPAQAWALHEIALTGGLLGIIQVGAGKTVLDLLAPMAMRDCRLALLLVPPTLVAQLVAEYELVAQHFAVPTLVVQSKGYKSVRAPGGPVLHVLPYSKLSRPESTVFLEELAPDTIIADEVHLLRHPEAVRTARLLRYFAGRGDTRFCGWSGSITDNSVKNYAHLSALALRHGSPLPLDPDVVDDWSRALDPVDVPAPPGGLLALCAPGEHVREGFHRRLVETPGVVTTGGPVIAAELDIRARVAPPIPGDLRRMMAAVRATWTRPDGEEFVDALTLNRCLRELAQGIYLRWIFPRGEPRAMIDAWFEARKSWGREMREMLRDRREHMDSPLLCARAAQRAWGDVNGDPDLPAWRAESWPRWRDLRHTVQPETEAVRVDDYLARDAAAWGAENRGVVWYSLVEFGRWVSEISGLPQHGGGPDAGERIGRERGDRSIVASIKSHGTGRDGLQRLFCAQLIASPPSSSSEWQQVLGRLHRIGQKAEVVRGYYYSHTPELAANVEEALNRAHYVRATIGEEQKLLAGRADRP